MRWRESLRNAARLAWLARMPRWPFSPRSRPEARDEADQRGGLVGVEVVDDEVPARGGGVGRHHARDVGEEVGLGARRAARWGDDLPGDHVPTDDEGAGAVPDVLELAPLDLAGGGRQPRVLALQRLDAGQLVGAHHALPPRGQRWRGVVEPAHIGHLLAEALVGGRGQPVADAVGLEIPLWSSRAAWRGEIAGRMPRATISSATSRPVHWLIGRPVAPGASQASATIRQVCSAVIRAGAPLRGASASRSSTLRSASARGCKPSQRPRHRRTASTSTPRARATWAL
jgi:hypothetical protein